MKEYQLNVDPRILELLGPNLYTNIYYVLAELIANAYDADAKNVYIIANKDDIRVEDDGHGMSYEKGDIDNYLNVAGVSRTNEAESFTKSGVRRKMGRKGVGKLAALSVSENVDILTVADGERSGFVLSRHPDEGSKLRAIPDSEIIFEHVIDHGSAIVMRYPQYRLHKTLSSVKRNLLKIFPLVSSDFRIHIVRDDEVEVVDDFDHNVMKDLGALITLGDEFESLADLVPNLFPQKREELVTATDKKAIPLTMEDNEGVEHEYTLKVAGWIGTYKTTRGRKAEMSEFPDNFISLFANKKMGEFNILPIIGQNKLGEVYVVGQLHVDIFELSELPDMALSNRQGYKSDDPRYQLALEYIRRELLPDILKRREKFTDLGREDKKKKKQESQKNNEKLLRESIDNFRNNASRQAAKNLLELGGTPSRDAVEAAISDSINSNSPDLGLKNLVDLQKKKILISHTWADKPLADVLYQMLVHNNVPGDDILYTNCDDEACRIPEGVGVFDYLRDFFIESYSSQKIYVLFVTSENMRNSWGAVSEVGASWITKVDHKIFNIPPFKPEQPLNNAQTWQTTNRESPTEGDIWMLPLNADVFCQKIEDACAGLGYEVNGREDNKIHLGTLVSIRDN